MAVAGLSGHHPSFGDPLFIATMLGAQAPDFDLVAQIKGSMAYLKQHRAFSHSIPGVIFFASLIALSLSLLTPNAHFWQAFIWAFAGGLSHTLIDYFNTHGVALLWPLSKERKSFPLLKVFDPLVLIICLLPYWKNLSPAANSLVVLSGLAGYILLRIFLRNLASGRIKAAFSQQNIRRLWIMPSLKKPLFWDFVVETDRRSINGRLGILTQVMEIKADMPRQFLSTLTAKAKKKRGLANSSSYLPLLAISKSCLTKSRPK